MESCLKKKMNWGKEKTFGGSKRKSSKMRKRVQLSVVSRKLAKVSFRKGTFTSHAEKSI